MVRPVFLIILANPPEDNRSHHWAILVPEPGRSDAGKYITIGKSSLHRDGGFFKIYKHGYDLEAIPKLPTWETENGSSRFEEESTTSDEPRYEKVLLGMLPDSAVVDIVLNDQPTGQDEAEDAFVVEAEKVDIPDNVSRGDSLQKASQEWVAAYIQQLIAVGVLEQGAYTVVENRRGR
ncbi:MAG: hypothetical protein M1820_003030 [Bogoriella megaspora]|nr:MAG: hypothetical protein M1820_003030 [Bogoriella megaspora]